jgi:hypothetical protein
MPDMPRPYATVSPGQLLEVEFVQPDGARALVIGELDAVPEAAGGQAPRIRVCDAQRPPRHGRTLVDPYRKHLRRRLAAEPGVPVTRLLDEIRELGHTGSANLLVRYLNQDRAQTERASPPPRRLVGWIMSKLADLSEHERTHLTEECASTSPRSCARTSARWGLEHQHDARRVRCSNPPRPPRRTTNPPCRSDRS